METGDGAMRGEEVRGGDDRGGGGQEVGEGRKEGGGGRRRRWEWAYREGWSTMWETKMKEKKIIGKKIYISFPNQCACSYSNYRHTPTHIHVHTHTTRTHTHTHTQAWPATSGWLPLR